MKKVFSMDLAGRKLEVEVGRIAQMANGSALVKYGNTVVLSTITNIESISVSSSSCLLWSISTNISSF